MAEVKPRISVEYSEGATIAILTDEKILEDNDIKDIQQSVMALIEQNEKIALVIDFSNVKFLSSAMLGLLIRVSKKIYECHGRLKLSSIDAKLYEVFKITGLDKIFEIYPSSAEAVADLS